MIKYHIRRNKPSGDPPEGLFDDGGSETVEKVLFFVERYCYTLRTQQNKNFVAFGVGLCYNIDTQVTRADAPFLNDRILACKGLFRRKLYP